MSRPKKKLNYNPDQVMQDFIAVVVEAFGSYDDREDTTFPGLNAVAAEFGITALKARKLLITAGVYSTHLSRMIMELHTSCHGTRKVRIQCPIEKEVSQV